MKTFWIAAVVILSGLFLVGAASRETQWEYAKYGVVGAKCSWETSKDKIAGSEGEMAKFIGCELASYNMVAFLNYIGKDGWELSEIVYDTSEASIYYYFKRPR
jgi:hypothetical protein